MPKDVANYLCLEVVRNDLLGTGPLLDTRRLRLTLPDLSSNHKIRGRGFFNRVGTYWMHKAVKRDGVSARDVQLRNDCLEGWFAIVPLSELLIQ